MGSMGGKDSEFLLYMPRGFGTVSGSDFVTGNNPASAAVGRKITIYRYINGIILTMEFERRRKTVKNLEENLPPT